MSDKLNYFIEATDKRLARMEHKLDLLMEYKLVTSAQVKIISTVVAGLVSVLVWFLERMI